MNYESFFIEARQRNLSLDVDGLSETARSGLDNEALFQLPLLSMVVLTISKGKSKPQVSEIGQLVGECLERTVHGFKGSSQDIGWSANLRIRTIRALAFLERGAFAIVDRTKNTITATDTGRYIVKVAMEQESPLAFALMSIERSYQNIRAERGILEEVE